MLNDIERSIFVNRLSNRKISEIISREVKSEIELLIVCQELSDSIIRRLYENGDHSIICNLIYSQVLPLDIKLNILESRERSCYYIRQLMIYQNLSDVIQLRPDILIDCLEFLEDEDVDAFFIYQGGIYDSNFLNRSAKVKSRYDFATSEPCSVLVERIDHCETLYLLVHLINNPNDDFSIYGRPDRLRNISDGLVVRSMLEIPTSSIMLELNFNRKPVWICNGGLMNRSSGCYSHGRYIMNGKFINDVDTILSQFVEQT